MKTRRWLTLNLFIITCAATFSAISGQEPEQKGFGKKDGPGGFGPGMMGQRRKLIPQFDKDGDGRLNAEERLAAREFLKKQPGGFGKGKKGPGGFGPGNFLAKQLVDAIDADKDGKVSSAEWTASVKKFFVDADKDKRGTLNEAQLAEALNAVLPEPKFPGGFGGPGGGGKGGPGGGMFRSGPAIAEAILKRSNAKDAKVSLEQLTKAADELFTELDKGNSGKLDEAAVASGINQLMPPPPMFGGKGKNMDPAKPGPKVAPAEVKSYPDAKFYDIAVVRTIFLEFDNKDWEAELADFYHTDVEVPATVTVDGKKYPNVGVHFRGNSSYFAVAPGYKHSIHLAFDFINPEQRVQGYKSTNLLNSHDDPTFMHSVLYCNISGKYIPAPKANYVKVVINGESWGIYANQQMFNKDFLKENYKTSKGARWKVPGHPGASGGLGYIGENIQDYKRHYEIKTKDNEDDWKALIALCRTLDKTPPEKLEEALRPMLDVDAALWFLALDNGVINDDGYWVRASDYSLYRDPKGVFHIVPHDTNETFQPMMGGGFGGKGGGMGFGGKGDFGKGPKDGGAGGPRPSPYGLDPFVGMKDPRKPLYGRLLAVPSLREKYLRNLRTLADEVFAWEKLKPIVDQYRGLIEAEIELDTRKLSTLAEFRACVSDQVVEGGLARYNLRAFADGRRSYLLNHPEIKKLEK